MLLANAAVAAWASLTLSIHGERSQPSQQVPVTEEQRKTLLDILLKEKESRLSEAAAHAERLQAGVVFYLSVIVVGVITAVWRKDPPDWRNLRLKPVTTFLVLLFLFANVNMAAQAMALSLDATVNAKFVTVYLNPQIAFLAGWHSEATPWGVKVHDALYWDQWWADSKQLFTAVRDEASAAWIGVIAATSFIALALFEPRSVPRAFRWLAYVGVFGIAVFAGWLAYAIFLYRFLGTHFNDRFINVPTFHARATIATSLLIIVGRLVIAAARRNVEGPST